MQLQKLIFNASNLPDEIRYEFTRCQKSSVTPLRRKIYAHLQITSADLYPGADVVEIKSTHEEKFGKANSSSQAAHKMGGNLIATEEKAKAAADKKRAKMRNNLIATSRESQDGVTSSQQRIKPKQMPTRRGSQDER